MAVHWLIDVHRVTGGIEACQPHVADDHEFEWVGGVFEASFEAFFLGFAENMLLDGGAIAGTPGHDDADCAVFWVVANVLTIFLEFGACPIGTEGDDFVK